jgi:hypothetical protein
MIEGALVLILGIIIGGVVVWYYPENRNYMTEEPMEQPYDKYKNKDGLYSRKAVKESR